MLRLGVLAIAGLLATGPALAQGTPLGAAPEGQVVVVTDINFPPYLFRDEDGKVKGILKDKWALWSERTGVPVDLRGLEWSAAQKAVLAGEADVIEALAYRDDRTKLYEYSRPYAPVEARVYFHRSISGINDVASLRGFGVGAKDGSACGNWLKERGIETLRTFPTSEALVKAAAAEEVRLFCMDAPAAQYHLYKMNLASEFRQTPPLYSTQFHWAVKKGRTELLVFIERGYDKISLAELDAINERWLGNPLQFPIGTRYLYYAGGTLAALLAMAALLLLWNRGLRTRVAARTAALEESETRFRELSELSSDWYWEQDADFRFVEHIGEHARPQGARPLDSLGRTRWEAHAQALTPDQWAAHRALLEAHLPFHDLEYQRLGRDGTRRWVSVSGHPVFDRDGRFKGYRGVGKDITERKRAEEEVRQLNVELQRGLADLRTSEERFRSLTEFYASYVWELDEEYRLTWIRGRNLDDFGLVPEKVVGFRMGEIDIGFEFINPTWEQYNEIRERHEPYRDVRGKFTLADGTERFVSIWGEPIFRPDGSFAGYRGLTQDISEQLRLERALKQLNETLEQRVRDRTAELADANRELEAFAYSVSHDLRAPLRAIDRFAQMAIEGSAGNADPNVTRALLRVRASSQRMAQLINDLLSLSRVTRQELLWQQVDLSALANDIAGDFTSAEPARHVTLTIQPSMKARADLNLVRILLDNLLGNAWKFTAGREAALIEVGADASNGQIAYYVRDNGAGFDMQYSDKLFRAFERLHSDQEFPGTGIGLAIVERIVKRHGGRIWAEAALQKGATFHFTLGNAE